MPVFFKLNPYPFLYTILVSNKAIRLLVLVSISAAMAYVMDKAYVY